MVQECANHPLAQIFQSTASRGESVSRGRGKTITLLDGKVISLGIQGLLYVIDGNTAQSKYYKEEEHDEGHGKAKFCFAWKQFF